MTEFQAVVLVVEDEPMIRMMTADLVEEAGFEVVEASNADEAIAFLSSRNDVRVVLTDISMPGSMDGLKLAAAVRHRWPPVEIIVVSGNGTPEAHELPERGKFLAKPFAPEHLVSLVREMAA